MFAWNGIRHESVAVLHERAALEAHLVRAEQAIAQRRDLRIARVEQMAGEVEREAVFGHRAREAAGLTLLLEHEHVVTTQMPSGGQAGQSCPDDQNHGPGR
jgi:hypothetical protein